MKRNLKQLHPDKARVIRAKRRVEREDQQDEQFEEKFINNPMQALKKVQKKQRKSERDIEKQINFYGHIIEPFNMKNEKQIGDIDKQGFFIFKNNKNQIKDAWLDSLNMGNQQQLLKNIQKKILQTKPTVSLNTENLQNLQDQEQSSLNSNEQSDDQKFEDPELHKKRKLQEGQKIIPKQPEMSPLQIKYLLSELLPSKMNCANYMKQLKPKKITTFKKNVRKNQIKQQNNQQKQNAEDEEQYQKILTLCNLYIELTGDHQIMTLTKQKLAAEIQRIEKPNKNQNKDQQDEDNIF